MNIIQGRNELLIILLLELSVKKCNRKNHLKIYTKYLIEMNEIILSKVDYSGLNTLILSLLKNSDSNVSALNRLNQTIKQARQVESEMISSDLITMNTVA